jgi:RNA polymerase sigma factor (sigma-70 family)
MTAPFTNKFTLANIDQLWSEYYPKVYGYFFRRVNNRVDVEDLTSIVLTEFFNNTLDNPKILNPHGYLWSIAYFRLIDHIRTKSKTPRMIEIDDSFVSPDNLETTLEAKILNEKFTIMLTLAKDNLTAVDYTLFHSVYIDGH